MSGNHDGLWALPRIGRQADTMGILVKGKKVKIQKNRFLQESGFI